MNSTESAYCKKIKACWFFFFSCVPVAKRVLPGGAPTLLRLLRRGKDRRKKRPRLFLSTPAIHYLAAGGEEGREEECTSLNAQAGALHWSARQRHRAGSAAPPIGVRKTLTRLEGHVHPGCGEEARSVSAHRQGRSEEVKNNSEFQWLEKDRGLIGNSSARPKE